MAREKIDLTVQEKQDVQATDTPELHQQLAAAMEQIKNIMEEKKGDPHLSELRNELKDINGGYKERIDLSAVKRDYIIQVLKTRRST